jgi:hypothetical protein
VAANCQIEWLKSPHADDDLIGDKSDLEAFIFAKREIKKGEELLWFYSVTQAHRSSAPIFVSHLTHQCKCFTTCVGTCVNSPLPEGATRKRSKKEETDL